MADIAISMDGKGAWRNNVFVERLWRSVKYEAVYLLLGELSPGGLLSGRSTSRNLFPLTGKRARPTETKRKGSRVHGMLGWPVLVEPQRSMRQVGFFVLERMSKDHRQGHQ